MSGVEGVICRNWGEGGDEAISNPPLRQEEKKAEDASDQSGERG